jgi:hypothetical protein
MGCITNRACTYVCFNTTGHVSDVYLLIHVQFRFRLIIGKLYKLDAGQWYRLIQLYSGISHSDSVTVVSSFYLCVRVVGRGKDRWL